MHTALRTARIAALLATLALTWLLLPAGLGGSASFVGTRGVSMEPLFHTGDLAVLRTADEYHVGDVVGYQSQTLNTLVLHRVVRSADGVLTTKGDNNSWEDPDHPRPDQVIGRLWVAVPHGGRLMTALRSPAVLAPLGLVVTAVTGVLGTRRRGRARAQTPTRSRATVPTSVRARAGQVALGATAVAALAAAGTAAAFSASATHTVAHPLEVTVHGAYGYQGSAERGVTYPEGVIRTGDPVWLNLSSRLTVSLEQRVEGASAVDGSLRLDLAVTTSDGWSASLDSGPTTPVAGGAVTATVPVDFTAASSLVRRHYDETGASGSGATLTVTPVGTLSGTAAGQPFSAPRLAPLSFDVTSSMAQVSGGSGAVLTPSSTASVTGTAVEPTAVHVVGRTLSIGALRGIACLVLAAALITLVVAGAVAAPRGRRSPADLFLLRHGARILPVTAVPEGGQVVDVPDGEALHRLAVRLDALVLHHEGPDGHTFLVRDGATTYRFRGAAAPAPTRARTASSGRHSARGSRPAPTMTALLGRLAQL
jgi:signal peptidase I